MKHKHVRPDRQAHGTEPVKRRTVMPVQGIIETSEKAKEEMFRDGLRYGDPNAPRYATSRSPAAPPPFPFGRVAPDGDVGEKTTRRK